MNRFKTMRDIPTQQNRVLRTASFSRAHAINQFALLEHEKMRLERQLQVWDERRAVTEAHLAQVHEKLRMISEMLLLAPATEGDAVAQEPSEIETALAAKRSRGQPPATATLAPAEIPAPPAPKTAAKSAQPPKSETPPAAKQAPAKPAPAAEPPPRRGLILEY